MWFSGNFKPKGKTALILGASQGLGADLALKLYQENCSVILVARTESKLKAQVETIRGTSSKESQTTANYIPCDASDYNSCVELWKNVYSEGWDPDYIFCCAGSSIPKLFGDLSGSELSMGITTNYSTTLNLIHSGFKEVKQKLEGGTTPKPRHIILFSSVVSFFPFIGYAQYAPMKAAIQSLSIILRQELGPFNYRVSCVFPGNFQSEGFDEEQKTKPEITKTIEGPSSPIPGPECAQIVLNKLDQGYDTITTDAIGWLLGCSVLGVLPRTWGFLQVLVSLVFSIIAPIANWVIYRDIVKYFDKEKRA
ncbi:3-ketodihydrosphingosine reductase Tsc10p [[Candida] anglica]|uniref:3-ketodihydrosphingosine reductase TSC10 n=1 Tax=[Candida] anglica TaxID=148631 RepID=A0ABP0EFK9_9ASCO